eukprot:gene13007-14345_t
MQDFIINNNQNGTFPALQWLVSMAAGTVTITFLLWFFQRKRIKQLLHEQVCLMLFSCERAMSGREFVLESYEREVA